MNLRAGTDHRKHTTRRRERIAETAHAFLAHARSVFGQIALQRPFVDEAILHVQRACTARGRWIALFEDTANALCPPQAASHFIERARRIADSLELGIASSHGKIQSPRFSTVARQSARPAATAEQVSCG